MMHALFEQIRSALAIEFEQSDLMRKRKEEEQQWAYSVCGTPLIEKLPVLIGINWGGGSKASGDSYLPQDIMPTTDEFLNCLNKGDYKFLTRSEKNLSKYADIDVRSVQFNYINQCFFRTPRSGDLTAQDYKSSLPILKELVTAVQPEQIIKFGVSGLEYLQCDGDTFTSAAHGRFCGYRGQLWGASFYAVPHPNARVPSADREAIWQELFRK